MGFNGSYDFVFFGAIPKLLKGYRIWRRSEQAEESVERVRLARTINEPIIRSQPCLLSLYLERRNTDRSFVCNGRFGGVDC